MNFSKKIVAVALILCLLLSVVPVFATTESSNILSVDNYILANGESIEAGNATQMPTTGSTNAKRMRMQLSAAAGKALGDTGDYPTYGLNTTLSVEGTPYEGLLLSGKIHINSLSYKPNVSSNAGINKLLQNGCSISFSFENVEVTHVSRASGGPILLEIPYNQVIANATDVKVFSGTIVEGTEQTFNAATDTTAVEALTAELFPVDNTNDYRCTNMVVSKDLTKYKAKREFNLGKFPTDTLFFATQPYLQKVSGNDWATVGYAVDNSAKGSDEKQLSAWIAGNAGGWSNVTTNGPFSIITPKASGTYYVYGLRVDINNGDSTNRRASIRINNVRYPFDTPLAVKDNNYGWPANSGFQYAWDKCEEQTVTLHEGERYFIQLDTLDANCRLAAVAFVPVTANVPDYILYTDDTEVKLNTQSNLDFLTNNSFTITRIASYKIKLVDQTTDPTNTAETEVTVKPHNNQITQGRDKYDITGLNVAGQASKYGTVLDAVTSANIGITADNVGEYQIYYADGTREYMPAFATITPSTKITVKKDPVTVENFAPYGIVTRDFAGSTDRIRLWINPENVPDVLKSDMKEIKDKTKAQSEAVFKDARLSGYMEYSGDVELAGKKVYFNNVVPESVTVAGSGEGNYNGAIPEFKSYYSTTLPTVTTPQGETVHDPYKLYYGSGVAYYGVASSNKEVHNSLFWVNSSITGKVYTQTMDGETLIRCDGFKLVYVTIKHTDNTFETVAVELLPNKAYALELKTGETAYVWENTPYNGTTLKPLLQPIEK